MSKKRRFFDNMVNIDALLLGRDYNHERNTNRLPSLVGSEKPPQSEESQEKM
jgi:hypothetical protein